MEVPRNRIAFGALSFIIGMALLLVLGGMLQSRFGMVGMILTELMILAVALFSALASRMDLRQVFRIKRSSGLEWLGSFLIYLSAFFAAAAASYLLTRLMPSVVETGAEINGFILSGGFILALIGVTVLPGICEEAWHRGFLLSSLGSIKSVAARVLIMGIVFGLFHFDPTRFLQTMLLGFALSFMRIKTDNLLPSIVFHCFNNLISVTLVFALSFLGQSIPSQALQAAELSQEPMPLEILIPLVTGVLSLSVLCFALARHVFRVVDDRRAMQPVQSAAPLQPASPAQPMPLAQSASSAQPMPLVQPTPSMQPTLPAQLGPSIQPVPSTQSMPPVSPSWPAPSPPSMSQQTAPPPPSRNNIRQTVVIVVICSAVALLSCAFCFVLSALSAI
jgi:membrane protease YdiL (CAAX protease family)